MVLRSGITSMVISVQVPTALILTLGATFLLKTVTSTATTTIFVSRLAETPTDSGLTGLLNVLCTVIVSHAAGMVCLPWVRKLPEACTILRFMVLKLLEQIRVSVSNLQKSAAELCAIFTFTT